MTLGQSRIGPQKTLREGDGGVGGFFFFGQRQRGGKRWEVPLEGGGRVGRVGEGGARWARYRGYSRYFFVSCIFYMFPPRC